MSDYALAVLVKVQARLKVILHEERRHDGGLANCDRCAVDAENAVCAMTLQGVGR